ncbi:MAG: GNAT family N-acetyltransferase [Alphaproteobacteria bacterium]|nr:GNAT family N-acetyltransferase [Alphaproteobacteria bacterium]
MTIRLETWSGDAIAVNRDALARLRIAVFRDFPYLYDGDFAYERGYLQTYIDAPEAVVVAALDGTEVVGAATALPLADETDDVKAPFLARGMDLGRIFYFGESILLSAYRGRGIGHGFFDGREARARRCGAAVAAFCAVQRPADHPRRPAGYRPLDDFWRKRGYRPEPGMTTTFAWQDLDETSQSAKPMQFWLRDL